jgi:hypothetical protein
MSNMLREVCSYFIFRGGGRENRQKFGVETFAQEKNDDNFSSVGSAGMRRHYGEKTHEGLARLSKLQPKWKILYLSNPAS